MNQHDRTISGTMGLFEGTNLQRDLRNHLYGRAPFALGTILAFVAMVVGGVLVGGPAIRLLVQEDWAVFAALLAFLATIFALVIGFQRLDRWQMRRLMAARGLHDANPVAFTISNEGLRMESEFSDTILKWPAVSEIVPLPLYWMIIVGRNGYLIPRRSFSNSEDERAFASEIMRHLGPEAIERSDDATAFLRK